MDALKVANLPLSIHRSVRPSAKKNVIKLEQWGHSCLMGTFLVYLDSNLTFPMFILILY